MTHVLHPVAVAFAALCVASFVAPARAEVKASKESLQGTWAGKVEIDEAVLKTDEKFKEIPAEQAELVLGLLKNQFGKMTMTMTLNADGTASAEMDGPGIAAKDKKKEGTWEVVKTDGATITIKITPKVQTEKDKPKDVVLTHVDEKTLTMGFPGKDGEELPKGIAFKFTKK
jgi:hypothetical protein